MTKSLLVCTRWCWCPPVTLLLLIRARRPHFVRKPWLFGHGGGSDASKDRPLLGRPDDADLGM